MKILYFAWLRTKVGIAEEDVTPPDSVTDIASLLDWLRDRGPQYRDALCNPKQVRAAVNQEFAQLDQLIGPNDEIALFPPVTGG